MTRTQTMTLIKLAGIVLAVVVVVLLAVRNSESVETDLLFFQVRMSRFVLLLVTLLIGFAAGVLFATLFLRRGRG